MDEKKGNKPQLFVPSIIVEVEKPQHSTTPDQFFHSYTSIPISASILTSLTISGLNEIPIDEIDWNRWKNQSCISIKEVAAMIGGLNPDNPLIKDIVVFKDERGKRCDEAYSEVYSKLGDWIRESVRIAYESLAQLEPLDRPKNKKSHSICRTEVKKYLEEISLGWLSPYADDVLCKLFRSKPAATRNERRLEQKLLALMILHPREFKHAYSSSSKRNSITTDFVDIATCESVSLDHQACLKALRRVEKLFQQEKQRFKKV